MITIIIIKIHNRTVTNSLSTDGQEREKWQSLRLRLCAPKVWRLDWYRSAGNGLVLTQCLNKWESGILYDTFRPRQTCPVAILQVQNLLPKQKCGPSDPHSNIVKTNDFLFYRSTSLRLLFIVRSRTLGILKPWGQETLHINTSEAVKIASEISRPYYLTYF